MIGTRQQHALAKRVRLVVVDEPNQAVVTGKLDLSKVKRETAKHR